MKVASNNNNVMLDKSKAPVQPHAKSEYPSKTVPKSANSVPSSEATMSKKDKGEDVLLQVQDVYFQKLSGTLFVLTSRVAWAQHGQDDFAVTIYFSDIDKLKISAATKPKKQLQIILHNAEPYTFLFNRPNHAEQDRDSVKEMIQQILPKFERKINSELEDKIKILQNNPQLFKLYQGLVPTGIMTAQEFWAARSNNESVSQSTGVSSSFLNEIQPSGSDNLINSNNTSLHYNLKADTIQSIFKMYPTVHEKYKVKVLISKEMTEQQFWAAFFQSHYIHRERIGFSSKEIFADCAVLDEKEYAKLREEKLHKSSFTDITHLDDSESSFFPADKIVSSSTGDSGSAEGGKSHDAIASNSVKSVAAASSSYGSQTIKTLIKRTNQHSSKFVSGPGMNSDPASAVAVKRNRPSSTDLNSKQNLSEDTESAEVDFKRSRLEEICRLDDLTTEGVPDIPTLDVSGPQKFSQCGIDESLQNLLPKTSRDLIDNVNNCANQFTLWESSCEGTINAIGAINLNPVTDFSQISLGKSSNEFDCGSDTIGTSLNRSSPIANNYSVKVNSEIKLQMQTMYLAVQEICRNFWSCFPVDSPEKEQKLERSFESVLKFETTMLNSFIELCLERNQLICTTHMQHMIQLVKNKYSNFKSNSKPRKK